MWSINEFCEPLDHEFSGIGPIKKLTGVRLDEDWGVKQYCELQALKSADFLVLLKSKHAFLEFSDIGRQIDQTLEDIKAIKKSNVSSALTRSLSKNLRTKINQEARGKYIDTCAIFSSISNLENQKLHDMPPVSLGCKFIIVYAPFSQKLQNSPADLARVIDQMQNNLTTSIPDEMFHGVEVITLEVFRKRYE